MTFAVMIHVVCHYINFYTAENLKMLMASDVHYRSYAGISGHVMIVSLFISLMFSSRYFRTKNFELFYYLHHVSYLLFIAYAFHGLGCFVKTNGGTCLPYYSYAYFLPILAIYTAEKVYKWTRPNTGIKSVTFYKGTYKIVLPKIFDYQPGQFVTINCPDIDYLETHPYSLISCSKTDQEMCVLVRESDIQGEWSCELRKLLENYSCISLKIDGPFATPCDRYTEFNNCVFIATGIGITPFISILKNVMYSYARNECTTRKIKVIWINRQNENFDWFNEDLKLITGLVPSSVLDIEVFLTKSFDWDTIKEGIYNDINSIRYLGDSRIPIGYGRPDFRRIISAQTNLTDDDPVGIFTCTNNQVNNTVKKNCKDLSNKSNKLNFIREVFD
jgi:NADPH oxidase